MARRRSFAALVLLHRFSNSESPPFMTNAQMLRRFGGSRAIRVRAFRQKNRGLLEFDYRRCRRSLGEQLQWGQRGVTIGRMGDGSQTLSEGKPHA